MQRERSTRMKAVGIMLTVLPSSKRYQLEFVLSLSSHSYVPMVLANDLLLHGIPSLPR